MRCKKCLKTFRTPPESMKKDQICTFCQKKTKTYGTNTDRSIPHYTRAPIKNENSVVTNKIPLVMNRKQFDENEPHEKSHYRVQIEEDEKKIEKIKITIPDIRSKIIFLTESIKQIENQKDEILKKISELQNTKDMIMKNKSTNFLKKLLNISENKAISSLEEELNRKNIALNGSNTKLIGIKKDLESTITIHDNYEIEIKYLEEQILKNKFKLISQEENNSQDFENKSHSSSIDDINSEIDKNEMIDLKNCVEQIIIQNEKEKFHNLEIKEKMTDLYFETQSIRKISEVVKKPQNLVREYVRTPKRLPENLKKIYDENVLSSDPKLGLSIALYATDYFQWDGEDDNQEQVLGLAENIADFFKINSSFRNKFYGIQINLPRINNLESRTKKLENLKKKYPYVKTKFNPRIDRSLIQYGILVSTRNLELAEYVLKWEHDNKKRFPKTLANKILSDPIEFLKENRISE